MSNSHLDALRRIPRGIWALGLVSLLMDVSSEMIHALLPLYMVTVLGASAVTVGVIEGIAEATASITKVFSGLWSDRVGRRKPLVTLGYGLAAISKLVFPLASHIGWVATARIVDRIGKGIRGAPRDALVADLSPASLRAASFGLRQSLDTIGAFIGPLLAIALMAWTAGDLVAVFWVAAIPAFATVAVMFFGVQEPDRPASLRTVRSPWSRSELRHLGAQFWQVVLVAVIFTLARFSEAFLILKGQAIGLPAMFAPVVLIAMNIVYSLSAYPAGVWADRWGRKPLLLAGLSALIAADVVLARAAHSPALLLGIALWGLHLGLTQGILAALVADTAPGELRGTAFGLFHLATGLATLAASTIAGLLWQFHGASATFLAGAAFALLALVLMAALPGVRHAT